MWKLKLLLAVAALSVAALLVPVDGSTTTSTTTTSRSVGWVARSRPKECAKGSSVWCKDLRWAKKCGAVKYCIQVVWEKMKLDPDPSNICDTCKEMVKEARDVLESNSTQELLAEVLEGTCQIYFPIKVLSRECIKYVDEFVPELVAMLSSRMDPQAVCSIAWLCNSNKLAELIGDVRLVENKIKPKTGDTCADCKAFMVDVVAKVQAMGKGQLEVQLNQGCKELKGFISTLCEKAVDGHIDEIYNDIINMKPDQTCKMAAMCIDGVDKVFKNAAPIQVQLVAVNSGDAECDFCVQLVTRLKETITANSSKEEMKQTLLDICTQLKSYKDKCVAYVNDYFEEIYEFLVDEMNPPVICRAMGLCKQQFTFLPGVKLINGATPLHLTGADESNSINWKPKTGTTRKMDVQVQDVSIKVPVSKQHPQQQPMSNQRKDAGKNCQTSNGPSCAICEYALHQIQQILTENSTEEQIKEAIDKVCNLLPSTLSDQCTKFVSQYGDAILALLAQEMDPSIVCTELGLCASEKIEVMINVPHSMPVRGNTQNSVTPFTVNKSSTCLLCEFLASQLEKMLSKNSTKEEIRDAVEKACSLMPKSVRDECNQFVENYADIIVDILVQTLDSNILCSALGVCATAPTAAGPTVALSATAQRQLPLGRMFPGTVNMRLEGKESCLYCQYAMQLVHTILNSNGTMDEVILGLDNLCHQLPRDYTDRCDTLVEQYAGVVLDTLRTMDLTQFCHLLSFCQGSVAETLREHANSAAIAAVQHANNDNCAICEATVEIVDKLLVDPNINNEIVHATKQVCVFLPAQSRPKCQSIIDVYGPYVIQTIGELAEPKQVCQVIQLCAQQSGAHSGSPTLLGGKKCTYGPAYWCKSKIHAKACGAEKHCKDFVWKN